MKKAIGLVVVVSLTWGAFAGFVLSPLLGPIAPAVSFLGGMVCGSAAMVYGITHWA